MAEQNKKLVKPSALGKTTVEQGQLDLTGFRMGKERLVSKKKKKSALKKVILDDREYRRGEDGQPLESGVVGSFATVGGFSLDAPEFVPSGWSNATASGQDAGTTSRATEQSAAGNAEEASESGAKSVIKPVPKILLRGSDNSRARSPLRGSAQDLSAVPAFVPSWCQEEQAQPAEPRPASEWLDAELPVTEAIEKMSKLQDESKRSKQEKKPKAKPGADIEVRHYVHQVLSDELDEKVKVVLGELVRFQERAKEKEPLKYAKLKRFCVGMREAQRSIARGKAKGLICAPNLEESSAEGGLDDTVEDLIDAARDNEVPVIFALSRNRMGKALGKNIRLSIVCILSTEGAHPQFKECVKLSDELRRQWVLHRMANISSEDAEEAARRLAEKAERNAERKAEKERLAAEKKAEDEEKRLEAKAAKQAAKVVRSAERQVEIERRRAEKAAVAEEEDLDKSLRDAERRAEEDKKREEEERKANEAERVRLENQKRIQAERAKKAEEEAARAKAQKQAESDSDSETDSDVPLGFNGALF